jgi:hypothetical protein
MKSYIKIYGPPILKALDELEKVAGEMPGISFYYHYILGFIPVGRSATAPFGEGEPLGVGEKYKAKSKSLVSKSGYTLGDYDFFFQWEKEPDGEQLRNLIEKIENALTPLGCKYTITTK